MLTLYYSPGACSMASHIALEETGAPYEAKLVSIAKGEHRTPEYLAVNPRAKVPALRIDDRVLTENAAILFYVAHAFFDARLLPLDPLDGARCLSTLAWFSNTVHPSFARTLRPERFAADPAAEPAVKASGREAFWANCQEIDGLLKGKDWVAGVQYTVCDPYALVFYGWGLRAEFAMRDLRAYTDFKDRMLARPAVRKVLEREDSILLR